MSSLSAAACLVIVTLAACTQQRVAGALAEADRCLTESTLPLASALSLLAPFRLGTQAFVNDYALAAALLLFAALVPARRDEAGR